MVVINNNKNDPLKEEVRCDYEFTAKDIDGKEINLEKYRNNNDKNDPLKEEVLCDYDFTAKDIDGKEINLEKYRNNTKGSSQLSR